MRRGRALRPHTPSWRSHPTRLLGGERARLLDGSIWAVDFGGDAVDSHLEGDAVEHHRGPKGLKPPAVPRDAGVDGPVGADVAHLRVDDDLALEQPELLVGDATGRRGDDARVVTSHMPARSREHQRGVLANGRLLAVVRPVHHVDVAGKGNHDQFHLGTGATRDEQRGNHGGCDCDCENASHC